jgi:hypothetical protein
MNESERGALGNVILMVRSVSVDLRRHMRGPWGEGEDGGGEGI